MGSVVDSARALSIAMTHVPHPLAPSPLLWNRLHLRVARTIANTVDGYSIVEMCLYMWMMLRRGCP